MFQMMNEARIGVGMGAVMLGYAGYLALARLRPRAPAGAACPTARKASPVAIIEHADVRRCCLRKRRTWRARWRSASTAAGWSMTPTAQNPTPAKKRETELLLDLLTPIAKSWPSEFCLEANKHAIQVLGGYGYTRDYPVERLYRDNRLTRSMRAPTAFRAWTCSAAR